MNKYPRNLPIEEFIITYISNLQKDGLRLTSISIDEEDFKELKNALGYNIRQTKKGHIQLWIGHPWTYNLVIKKGKKVGYGYGPAK